MRIILLTTGLVYAGAEVQVFHLATRLKSRGWDVMVVSMLPPKAFVEELEERLIPVLSLGMRRGTPDPRAIVRLALMTRQWRPHVIHSHMVHANLLARMSRLCYWSPATISTIHNTFDCGKLGVKLYAVTDWLADATTAVSRAASDRYTAIGAVRANKCRFIPNGVDMSEFKPDPAARARIRAELGLDQEFTWLAIGRLEPAKDYPNMFAAFAEVARGDIAAQLLVIGQGSLESDLRRQAASAACNRSKCTRENVQFLGVRRDIPDIMNAADGYVMSSAWEGMPVTLLEASAAGLPIVATDVGGNREVVRDGSAGFIVEPGNPEALAEAMRGMMNIPLAERREMGRAGRAFVESEYGLERMVDNYERLYTELLARKGFAS
ncbi:MAG: glycosyltransferase [Armatimonadetes bacterium]|nr:glycosyltransferase [Armatimonadota bacterium]